MTKSDQQKKKRIVYFILIAATLAVFWQINQSDFINYDDDVYVTENSHVTSGITLDGIRWAFTTTYAEFWHPLTWLSLMTDYQLHGLNAGGYHVTNLILHILSTLLLFWLFNRMTGAVWRSAFVAAFFALHPLHVESVAWVSERKDVLSAFFWMLTLCLYVYYTEKPVVKRYLPVLFSFVLALMSKPMVVTLPVIMILLDYWPLSRYKIGIEAKKDNLLLWQFKEKLPFFVLSGIFSIITIYAQYNTTIKYALKFRLANALVSFMIYLKKILWPLDMAVIYPFPSKIPNWQVLGASILIIIFFIIVILTAKRLRYLFFGWIWYAITILPVVGIVPIGPPMADRYLYLPSIGIAVIMAWGIPSLMQRKRSMNIFLWPIAIILLLLMSALSLIQCGYWKNSITLFSHTLQVTTDNYTAHNNLGIAMFKEGKMEEALLHYNEAINIKPHYTKVYNNRGITYTVLGKHLRAIEDYNMAIHMQGDCAQSYYNRGISYMRLGRYQQAVRDYTEAIRLQPDSPHIYYHRGLAYMNLGQYYLALHDYNQSIRLKPDNADSWNNRAFIYLTLGNLKIGCDHARKACAMGTCATLEAANARGYCR